jgi:DNA (cytosine-5)-methyltransferase 1
VRLPWKVFDVAEYGVPQHRERLILIGAKRGQPLPDYPSPTSRPADSQMISALPVGPTCRDALDDLPDAEQYRELLQSDNVLVENFDNPSAYAAILRCLHNRSWHYGYRRRWDSGMLTSSLRTIHTEISQRRFTETAPGQVEPISRFYKLAPDGLSNTLRAGTDSARGAFTSPRPIHYQYPRCVTVREMARLHGFPDWFRFHGTKWHGARQIGNSVPPPFARAIAGEVIRALGVTPERSRTDVALGDPALIWFDMSGASKHFGVPVPIRKRDRKSGARKRKQYEIEAESATTMELCLA